MSYDVSLLDPVTHRPLELDAPHHFRGGTYQVVGSTQMSLNVTYNYAELMGTVLDGGIRSLYGRTGAETLGLLKVAAAALTDDTDPDYWKPAPGNVKRALLQLLAFAQMRPDGVWDGD